MDDDDGNRGPPRETYFRGGINFLSVVRWIREWRENRRLERERKLRLREWRKRD